MADPTSLLLTPELPAWEPFSRIGLIANRVVPKISPWLTALRAAAVVRAAGGGEALVVDGDGVPLGMISVGCLDGAARGTCIRELMTPIGVVLHESVPLSVAAALMLHPEDGIAVVSDDRQAIGVLAAADLLRWKASRAVKSATGGNEGDQP